MATFWDLLPASPWSARPYPSPSEQAQPVPPPANQLQPLPMLQDLAGRTPLSASWSGAPSYAQQAFGQFLPTVAPLAAPDKNLFGGILGALVGTKPDDAAPPTAQSSPQYGVVPKNISPEVRPPPVPDWQKPESEFGDTPSTLARIESALAAGVRPDRMLINSPGARLRRDNARIAELLFPGTGNLVSGDWNAIGRDDLANLAISLASTFVPPARGGALARTGIRAVRAASEAEAAVAAARAVAARGTSARVAAPIVGKVNAPTPAPIALELTGQDHHAISKKVHNALEEIPSLAGRYRHRDPRFVTQAIDKDAHTGYQTWHRDLDDEIAEHIRGSGEMTPEGFEQYLRNRYRDPDLLARFPNAL